MSEKFNPNPNMPKQEGEHDSYKKEGKLWIPKEEKGHICSSEEVEEARELIPEDKKIEDKKEKEKKKEEWGKTGGTIGEKRIRKAGRESVEEKKEVKTPEAAEPETETEEGLETKEKTETEKDQKIEEQEKEKLIDEVYNIREEIDDIIFNKDLYEKLSDEDKKKFKALKEDYSNKAKFFIEIKDKKVKPHALENLKGKFEEIRERVKELAAETGPGAGTEVADTESAEELKRKTEGEQALEDEEGIEKILTGEGIEEQIEADEKAQAGRNKNIGLVQRMIEKGRIRREKIEKVTDFMLGSDEFIKSGAREAAKAGVKASKILGIMGLAIPSAVEEVTRIVTGKNLAYVAAEKNSILREQIEAMKNKIKTGEIPIEEQKAWANLILEQFKREFKRREEEIKKGNKRVATMGKCRKKIHKWLTSI